MLGELSSVAMEARTDRSSAVKAARGESTELSISYEEWQAGGQGSVPRRDTQAFHDHDHAGGTHITYLKKRGKRIPGKARKMQNRGGERKMMN